MRKLLLITLLCSTSFSRASDLSEIKVLIAGLDDEEFASRASAHKQIEQWLSEQGIESLEVLEDEIKASDSPEVKIRLESIIHYYRVTKQKLGSIEAIFDAAPKGIKIQQVLLGGASQLAGIKDDDVIEIVDDVVLKKLGGNPDEILFQFRKMMLEKFEGEKLNITVRRGEKLHELTIKLGVNNPNKMNFEHEPRKLFQLDNLQQNLLLIPEVK